MTLEFGPSLTGDERGEIQVFLATQVDRDSDVHLAATSHAPGNYVEMRVYWRNSLTDHQEHLAGDVFFAGSQTGTAHIYRSGQVTMFPPGED